MSEQPIDDQIRAIAYRVDSTVACEDLLEVADQVEAVGLSTRSAVAEVRLELDELNKRIRRLTDERDEARRQRNALKPGSGHIMEDFGVDADYKAGGIYVSLNHYPVAKTIEYGPGVNVDYDADGVPTGVEILRRPEVSP